MKRLPGNAPPSVITTASQRFRGPRCSPTNPSSRAIHMFKKGNGCKDLAAASTWQVPPQMAITACNAPSPPSRPVAALTETRRPDLRAVDPSGVQQRIAGHPPHRTRARVNLCSRGARLPTFYKWRTKYAGMQAMDAKLLRELEAENSKLNARTQP